VGGVGNAGADDWEIWHNKGLCNMYLRQYETAADQFRRANAIQRHDATFMQLGKVRRPRQRFVASDVTLHCALLAPSCERAHFGRWA